MISITSALSIPDNEINFITSRSSGPGGQHVNKTSSKVTLVFNLEKSTALSFHQKYLIRGKLANRINSKGELHLSCEEHRSQFRNKEEVVERFRKLLLDGLKPPKVRRKTKVPYSTKVKRINGKKKRANVKKNRSRPDY
ncbi:alternative ribosome rescue aminoacyl-tRNA hydrolase ArfB [Maridesulfovibrio hydrothermalis]|uniref:Class I peptide chain release factor n=1 Tax=Maridesulfovibrio hydrothermalis AM13 = DSM 14728 TaxID=1121451 RepID=L0R869_9BACT|nr:alternative ribosome rescue aminoacyl-tRNA hydrolase ArfB [Maridesulfovibrio hydrothermalis]CCO22943.1 Class I peptide chain release factor [Maridesulfovibrio hydrothermalis AM13 = DSM 14728]